MNRILYGAYALLGGGLFVSCFPFFYLYTRLSGRYGRDLKERLGCVPRELVDNLDGSPRIWLHAVSLGEIGVAASIVKTLRYLMSDGPGKVSQLFPVPTAFSFDNPVVHHRVQRFQLVEYSDETVVFAHRLKIWIGFKNPPTI